MAKLEAYGKSFRDSLKESVGNVKVRALGLVAAGGALVASVSAETFNFSILTDLSTSLIALSPDVSALLDAGGPLVIKFCIIAAVCAPFVWIYKTAY